MGVRVRNNSASSRCDVEVVKFMSGPSSRQSREKIQPFKKSKKWAGSRDSGKREGR